MPSNEHIAPTPYNAKRIWWELERTALGDGYYGNALRVAKDMPGIDDKDRAVLDRWATGAQQSMDHVLLQGVAIKVYATHSTTAQAELASKPEAEDMKVPITTNGTTRMVPREEPVFLIRGQDSVGADTVRAWADLAEAAGAAPTLLQSARKHAEKMDRWPKKKVADNAHPPASSAPMQRALALAQGVAPNAAAILATFCHELVMGVFEGGAVRAAAQRALAAAGLSRLEQVVAVEADSGKGPKS